MSNSAVAKWLEEIAAAKAKAQAKEQQQPQQQQQQQQQQQEQSYTSIDGPPQPQPRPQPAATATNTAQYGTITSYNLRTRKKQLRLVLPPEPRKPGPGECCGNDCEPCVNTIYWEDMAAHREKCRKLKVQFEDACRALEDSEGTGREDGSGNVDVRKVEKGTEEDIEDDDDDDDGKVLSIRSYRPFKVLEKRYLSENTLLVFCDLPYYSKKKKDDPSMTMFHLLIRFQQADGQYLTKAFTPVDMSRLHTASGSVPRGENLEGDVGQGLEDRMAFLVKLYPSPHATSDMFRALEADTERRSNGGVDEDDGERSKKGVLFLRGPIQTGRDRQQNQQQQRLQQQQQHQNDNLNLTTAETGTIRHKKRIVMIAAGSGITPMYQVLRALHSQQHHQHQSSSEEVKEGRERVEEGGEQFWEADEVDLVYCNRTTDDIWLHQELQSFRLSCTEDQRQEDGGTRDQRSEEEISNMTAGLSLSLVRRTTVRVQHVLSSSSSVNQAPKQERNGNHQFHAGRITLDLLRNTLQPSHASHGHQKDNKEQLQILVCGPPLFNKDVSIMLASLEYHDSEFCEIHILE